MDSKRGIMPALVNKQYLHSNSTSHEWMFGALAEIIDNACDPDVMANQFWIDVKTYNGQQCLVLTDNGLGMDTKTLQLMLSFGFSDKPEKGSHLPIGRYGNGFKSGSMRLGKDALVFTFRHKTSMSVGMLSQTYLDKTNSETVVVPIVTWNEKKEIIYPENGDKTSLKHILEHSIFHSELELINQIFSIPKNRINFQGTRIIIYNLARNDQNNLELDFDTDPNDIMIPTERAEGMRSVDNGSSLYRHSLRKYLSILYLRHRMQMFLRGKKVQLVCLTKSLKNRKLSTYKPKFNGNEPIKIEFGLNPQKDEHGIVIYYRNRLIQAFRKFNYQKRELPSGIEYSQLRQTLDQVIGVVELNCITPNHIKQGFQDDSRFRNVELQLMGRMYDYAVKHVCEVEEKRKAGTTTEEGEDLWVQCDNPECQKWRRLPSALGITIEMLPNVWYCYMNPDVKRNSCNVEEEPEDEPDQLPKSNQKSRRNTIVSNENEPTPSLQTDENQSVTTPQLPPPQPQLEVANQVTFSGGTAQTTQQSEHDSQPIWRLSRSNSMENVLRQIVNEQQQMTENNLQRKKRSHDDDTTPSTNQIAKRTCVTYSRQQIQAPTATAVRNEPISVPPETPRIKEEPQENLEEAVKHLQRQNRNLKTLLQYKDSRIAVLETQMQDMRRSCGMPEPRQSNLASDNQDSDVIVIENNNNSYIDIELEEKYHRMEQLMRDYLIKIWGDYKPNPNGILEDVELLVRQAGLVSESNHANL